MRNKTKRPADEDLKFAHQRSLTPDKGEIQLTHKDDEKTMVRSVSTVVVKKESIDIDSNIDKAD